MSTGHGTPPVNEERDEETGKFAAKYQPADFLDALEELGGAAGTSDVAEIVGCPDRTAYYHLNNLHEEGEIVSQSVGAAKLWKIADDV